MHKIKPQLLRVGLFLFFVSPLWSQDIKLTSGNLGFLKGETMINVEYAYADLIVEKRPEQEFTQREVVGQNKQSPGKGDKWLKEWKASPATRYSPKFETMINKELSNHKIGLSFGKNPGAKYTLVFRTTSLEPGFSAVFVAKPALVNAKAEFFETRNRNTELAEITILKAPSHDTWGSEFDVWNRIEGAYGKAGKELAAFLYKKVLR
jgi:hypothetical protein